MTNTEIYKNALRDCLNSPCNYDNDKLSHELIAYKVIFNPDEHIKGTVESYVNHEIDWYLSQDLNIHGHPGIENNKIWKAIATKDGYVNSNYGWCIFSDANYNQLERACSTLVDNILTKHCTMIYSRPSINQEWNDGIHAISDMICTIYVQVFVRNNKIQYIVHMRSNDIWYGLRNDLAWHQLIQKSIQSYLLEHGITCELGDIIWFADSLHLYKRNYDTVMRYLND